MRARNPIQQLLKAYYNLFNGSIMYGGNAITVGTRIPRGQGDYIYLSVSSVSDISTGDGVIYNITITMQIVSLQEVSEGDETIINSLLDQVLSFVEDPDSLLMDDFKCIMNRVEGMEPIDGGDESNFIVGKKINILNFLEQTK